MSEIDPGLQAALDALFAAAPGDIGIKSGFRTRAEQEALYARYQAGTGNLAAKPGTSLHEKGMAADLSYASPGVQEWAHAHAAEYGLAFPIDGEPWHAELAGTRGGGSGAPGTAAPAAAGDLATRMAHIMAIVNGTGTDPQAGQWADTAPAPAAAPAAIEPATGGTVGGGVSGARSYPAAEGDKATYQTYAQSKLADFDWDAAQMPYLVDLWNRESGWNPNAQNPHSSAYGIAQFLDSTWKNYGTKTADPRGQIDAGLAYVKARYGTPAAAIAFWNKNGWY